MDMLGKVVQELEYNFSLKLDVGGTSGELMLLLWWLLGAGLWLAFSIANGLVGLSRAGIPKEVC